MLLATAGHVDHGKTSLIRALTGQETDRLEEEKRRGLTIELGFAYASTAKGSRLGFVDVPGHSKFIRNMASGVAAVDVALVVVAATEGVMPQTREHVALLSIFGIERCVLIVSKVDMLDADERDSTVASIRSECTQLLDQYSQTCIAHFEVSATTDEGIDTLRQYLFSLADVDKQQISSGLFRLAIDRAFSLKGTGTVVTGTVYSGSIEQGDSLVILPSGLQGRIKGLHVDGQEATRVQAGSRAALSITGLAVADIARGEWACSIDQTTVSRQADVKISLLDSAGILRHWQKVHVHGGAAMVPARVSLYEKRSIASGESAFAQIVFEQPQHITYADRLVIREQNAQQTIGGASVIDPNSERTKQHRRGRTEILQLLDHDSASEALGNLLNKTEEPIDQDRFRQSRNLSEQELTDLDSMSDAYLLTQQVARNYSNLLNSPVATQWLVSDSRTRLLLDKLLSAVESFHDQHPQQRGISRRDLLTQTGCSNGNGQVGFMTLLHEEQLTQYGQYVSLKHFIPQLLSADKQFLIEVNKDVTDENLKPPSLSALAEKLKLEPDVLNEHLARLEEAGFVVKIAKNRVYHPAAFNKLLEIASTLAAEAEDDGLAGFDAKTFRDRSGIGRNLSIDVLEYMDQKGFTRRLGDRRIMRENRSPQLRAG